MQHSYAVAGMTCEHCVSAVTEEVGAIPGVTGVAIGLVPGGVSTMRVSTDGHLTEEQVAGALDEAGDYSLLAES